MTTSVGSKIGYKYFKISNKKVITAFEKYLSEKDKMYAKFRKLARKIGAHPARAIVQGRPHGAGKIVGFHFDGQLSHPQLFKKKNFGDEGYIPRKDSWIYDELQDLGCPTYVEVEKLLGWEDQVGGGFWYSFNPFYFLRGKHFGFRAPAFENQKDNYVPKISGVKEITLEQYYKLVADKEMKNDSDVRRARRKEVQSKVRGNNNRSKGPKGRSGVLDNATSRG